jgi:ribosomal protein L44E
MDNMEVYCENCQRELKHEVLEMKEGETCWLVITVKCSECERVHEIQLYC